MSEDVKKDAKAVDYEAAHKELTAKVEGLEKQLKTLVKRYRKLSELFNDAIEKILSAE